MSTWSLMFVYFPSPFRRYSSKLPCSMNSVMMKIGSVDTWAKLFVCELISISCCSRYQWNLRRRRDGSDSHDEASSWFQLPLRMLFPTLFRFLMFSLPPRYCCATILSIHRNKWNCYIIYTPKLLDRDLLTFPHFSELSVTELFLERKLVTVNFKDIPSQGSNPGVFLTWSR